MSGFCRCFTNRSSDDKYINADSPESSSPEPAHTIAEVTEQPLCEEFFREFLEQNHSEDLKLLGCTTSVLQFQQAGLIDQVTISYDIYEHFFLPSSPLCIADLVENDVCEEVESQHKFPTPTLYDPVLAIMREKLEDRYLLAFHNSPQYEQYLKAFATEDRSKPVAPRGVSFYASLQPPLRRGTRTHLKGTSLHQDNMSQLLDNFDDFLEDPVLSGLLMRFLRNEFNQENLVFFQQAAEFEQCFDSWTPERRKEEVDAIVNAYFRDGAPFKLNLEHEMSQEVLDAAQSPDSYSASMFAKSKAEAGKLLFSDSFPRFKQHYRQQPAKMLDELHELIQEVDLAKDEEEHEEATAAAAAATAAAMTNNDNEAAKDIDSGSGSGIEMQNV